jgi:D-beta-D-heptose 7-phosphate kinase/D-beta-D-heptose 1-phosphate adenosyltransferase
MQNIDRQLARLDQATVLCIGDLMLDDFVYGEVMRISPEAPAPVLAVTRSELVIGGAGNVARNLASLGTSCVFVGVVGEDDSSAHLMRALAAVPLIEPHLVVDATRPTTRKVRFVSEHYSTHLLRADWELAKTIGPTTEKAVIDRALALLPEAASIVLSDYAKGVLTPDVVHAAIEAGRERGLPVVVDPKTVDFRRYNGATVVTPNLSELERAVRRTCPDDETVIAGATELMEQAALGAILVTRGGQGMTLV